MTNPLNRPGLQPTSELFAAGTWPAPWACGLLIPPLGMFIGIMWTALPFLSTTFGVAAEDISRMTAILQIPPMLMFIWTPVADVKLRRSSWLVLAATTSATWVCLACPLAGPSHFNLVNAGERNKFLIATQTAQEPPLTLVVNWPTLVKKR